MDNNINFNKQLEESSTDTDENKVSPNKGFNIDGKNPINIDGGSLF